MVSRHVLCLTLAFAGATGSSLAQLPDSNWIMISVGTGKIAVPKGWRDFRGIRPPMVLYRQGDGIGVPIVDETGSALQTGMTAEKFPTAKQSVGEIMDGLVKGAKQAPRLELVGKETVEDVKLADGTAGKLMTAEFVKEGRRRSLQLKLVVKDDQGTAWVVSSHLVGGLESKWPKPGSKYAKWLRAHLASLSLDPEKFDPKSVDAAYKEFAE